MSEKNIFGKKLYLLGFLLFWITVHLVLTSYSEAEYYFRLFRSNFGQVVD